MMNEARWENVREGKRKLISWKKAERMMKKQTRSVVMSEKRRVTAKRQKERTRMS
jgi:hypothetical protein